MPRPGFDLAKCPAGEPQSEPSAFLEVRNYLLWWCERCGQYHQFYGRMAG